MISTLVTWGDKFYSDMAGPPILRRHEKCGHDYQTYIACSECGDPLEINNVEARTRPHNDSYPAVERGPIQRGPGNKPD